MKPPPFLMILFATLVRYSLQIRHRTLYTHEDDYRQRKLRLFSDPVKPSNFSTEPKLSKVFHLNDNHQELSVQWAGEGTGVIICLAHDPSSPESPPRSAAVYISYDFGDTFRNETDKFQQLDGTTLALDKFYNHQNFSSWTVFTDSTNRVLYTTLIDNGKILVTKYEITFIPSELIFSEKDPKVFVILDKESENNKLWLTRDYGASFIEVMQGVTAVYWSSSWAEQPLLYVQRQEAAGLYTVYAVTSLFEEGSEMHTVVEGVLDFSVKKDFAFATRDLKGKAVTLLVSYQGSPFEEAHFDRVTSKHVGYYIADVSGSDILVAVNHDNELPTLYFSHKNGTIFSLSMRNFACFFPGKLWNRSKLKGVTNTAFADIYKVDGLHGIYIASQFQIMKYLDLDLTNLSTEHLSTVITFNKGKQWQLLNVPIPEARRDGDPCLKDNRCSLHLPQKFAGLFHGSQIMPPVTSQFAPAVIIATGTIGVSQKGEYGLFISTDAGITWWLALRGQYLYQIGDHGGAIVAMKYKEENGTNELLYSTDSGHKWHSQPFLDRDVHVVNMLSEVEGKSTIFTTFGTENYGNNWLAIKTDLREAFSKNCTKDDYIFWSLSTEYTGSVPCQMGEKEVYERRKPESSCYTGQNYTMDTTKELCDCSLEDFECDGGFIEHKFSLDCIRNKWLDSPYEVPSTCMPGDFYNRTKGYKFVPGDVCDRGSAKRYLPDTLPCPDREIPETIIASDRNIIYRHYIGTNNWEIVSQKNLTYAVALEVDVHNSCVYWADAGTHTIERQCMNGVNISFDVMYNSGKSTVEGLALDWVSHLLYFVESTSANIKVIRIDENIGNNTQISTILSSPVLKKPRGIAVHPREGLMFWTDWDVENPSVSRASANGSNVQQLFGKPDVIWPNGLAIDYIAERIYWVDARQDYVASADLDGLGFRKIITGSDKLRHPFAITVFKDYVYWSDISNKMIYQADKDNGENIRRLSTKPQSFMGIKVFAQSLQEGTNACVEDINHALCSHFCIGLPRQSYTCKCPDYLQLAGNNKCVPVCGEDFRCKNILECIPSTKHCDGFNDCSDSSDEDDCPQNTCEDLEIKCKTGNTCILLLQLCNGIFDCPDHSDENNCTTAATATTPASTTRVPCDRPSILCDDGKQCIPIYWQCDGDRDCEDGSDEKNCTVMTQVSCHSPLASCDDGEHCIHHSWVCDGERDCPDGSDENLCMITPPEPVYVYSTGGEFKCKNSSECIATSKCCDGVKDCSDNSDEEGCPNNSCAADETKVSCCSPFVLCDDGKLCIPDRWRCDGERDCVDGSDEKNCPVMTQVSCHSPLVLCDDGKECIPHVWRCDEESDCADGSDEKNCTSTTP